jgi:hypothetical protein
VDLFVPAKQFIRRWLPSLRPVDQQRSAELGLDQLPPPENCVFIIGAARTGTTILQNALNDSDDIFLFGEANFHTDPNTPDFAARYNAMHRDWANQETKSSFCPPILTGDAPWYDYLRKMAERHRYAGAKIVPSYSLEDTETLYAFHCRRVFSSRDIFTFRDPLATLRSISELQVYTQGHDEGPVRILRYYLMVVQLYIRMLRTLPNVHAFCHEDAGQTGLATLGAWLGVSLATSHLYYEPERIRPYSEAGLDEATRSQVTKLQEIYTMLRQGTCEGFALKQLDQNDRNLNPRHYTVLGRLAHQTQLAASGLDELLEDQRPNAIAMTAAELPGSMHI